MGAIRRGVTWVFRRLIVPAYFRDIEVLGDVPSRDVRGRLFVANHVNAILDPILVFVTAGCDISPVAKSTLWKVPGFAFLLGVVDSVRIVRRTDDPTKQGGSNDQVFDEVAAWLRAGGNILIFPEGTSHNEPHLVDLKSGAARMLLRAMETGPANDLTVQPVTLEFDDREEARSRVLIQYGPVRPASDFKGEGDAFLTAFNDAIRRDLSDQIVLADTWNDFMLVTRAAQMLAHDAADPSMFAWSRSGREVESALVHARSTGGRSPLDPQEPVAPTTNGRPLLDQRTSVGPATETPAVHAEAPAVAAAREAVNAYHDRLASLGLTDADVACPPPVAGGLARGIALFFALPLAATGMLLHGPPYLAVKLLAARVKSGDETSTIRLGVALVLHPPWTALLLALVFRRSSLPVGLSFAAALLLSPFAMIAWLDAAPRLLHALRRRRNRSRLPPVREARRLALSRVRALLSTAPRGQPRSADEPRTPQR